MLTSVLEDPGMLRPVGFLRIDSRECLEGYQRIDSRECVVSTSRHLRTWLGVETLSAFQCRADLGKAPGPSGCFAKTCKT